MLEGKPADDEFEQNPEQRGKDQEMWNVLVKYFYQNS